VTPDTIDRMRARPLFVCVARLALTSLVLLGPACGGEEAKTAADEVIDLDGDPIALLPGSGVALASIDVRAFYDASSTSGQVGKLAEKLIPIGEEAGFVASRDVDRIIVGAYTSAGLDFAAIVKGRFDEAKIARAAESHSATKNGSLIVSSKYADRTLYTVSNNGFAVLTPTTVVAGTEWGIRRTLEKIKDKRVKRAFSPWMVETVESAGGGKPASFAIAADFTSQPIASAAVGSIELPWIKGMRTARVIGNFKDPGMNFAGTLSYGEPGEAESAAAGFREVEGWLPNWISK
jgi:hypothetical protein